MPWLQGAYVYADYVSGRIWSLREESDGSFGNRLLLDSGRNIASFGTDRSGRLYLLAFDGRIYRFRWAGPGRSSAVPPSPMPTAPICA